MPIGNPQTLKERVDVLERTLLAINSLSNICEAATANNDALPLSEVAFLMSYLSDSSLYKVEALRMQIDALPATIATPITFDRQQA